jgi:hypothetical protein
VDLPVVQVFSHDSYLGIIRIDASARGPPRRHW